MPPRLLYNLPLEERISSYSIREYDFLRIRRPMRDAIGYELNIQCHRVLIFCVYRCVCLFMDHIDFRIKVMDCLRSDCQGNGKIGYYSIVTFV